MSDQLRKRNRRSKPTLPFRIIKDTVYGYYRLDPVLAPQQLDEWYQKTYYRQVNTGSQAPDLLRLMNGGLDAQREQSWLYQSLYSDILFFLKRYSPGNSLLDIGCGEGSFLTFAAENGLAVAGVEPAVQAATLARKKGLAIYQQSVESFFQEQVSENKRYDSMMLINVLEHIADPIGVLRSIKAFLSPLGVLCIRVPNDYTQLQKDARASINERSPWWEVIPSHINYFNFRSLSRMFKLLGYRVMYAQSDFPMEMFLLMGDDYIHQKNLGGLCHKKRISFELSCDPTLRRKFYQSNARLGIGRNCLMFATVA